MNGSGSSVITSKRDKRDTPKGGCHVTSRLSGNVTALHERDKSRSVTGNCVRKKMLEYSELRMHKGYTGLRYFRRFSEAIQAQDLNVICKPLLTLSYLKAVPNQCPSKWGTYD